MIVRINGKDEAIDSPKSLADIISGKGFIPERVVIEHNLRIVPAGEWGSTMVRENDNIEIISFMGGG